MVSYFIDGKKKIKALEYALLLPFICSCTQNAILIIVEIEDIQTRVVVKHSHWPCGGRKGTCSCTTPCPWFVFSLIWWEASGVRVVMFLVLWKSSQRRFDKLIVPYHHDNNSFRMFSIGLLSCLVSPGCYKMNRNDSQTFVLLSCRRIRWFITWLQKPSKTSPPLSLAPPTLW